MKINLLKLGKIMVVISLLFSGFIFYQGTASASISKEFWTKSLFELPSTDYDRAEADLMMDRIIAISPSILETLVYHDVKIRLINGEITKEPEYAHLKGVTPRGWEGMNSTWDDIPGVGGNPVIVRIGYSDMGQGHGSYNLELHETFHIIDYYAFDNISQSEQFYKIFTEEAKNLFENHQYQEVYPEEYFAEVATMYVLNQSTKDLLRLYVPETYAFLQQLFEGHIATPNEIIELERHWAKYDLERLSSLNVINGFPDGTIRPDVSVSREQFIKMLIESSGVFTTQQAGAVFKDVSNASWSEPFIKTAVAEGMILPEEYVDNKFEPTKILTRAEMAVWVARAMKLKPDEQALSFIDADSIADHHGLIGAVVKNEIINGMPQNLFQPDGTVTRAQAAAVLNRMLNH